jgi:MFS family permease
LEILVCQLVALRHQKMILTISISLIAGPPIGGAIIDGSGGYFGAFLFAGIILLFGCLSLLPVVVPKLHPDIEARCVVELGNDNDTEFMSFSESV